MKKTYTLILGCVLLLLCAGSALAINLNTIIGLKSAYLVNPGTAAQTITIPITLFLPPATDTTLASTLDGKVAGMTISSGSSLKFTSGASSNYNVPQNIVVTVPATAVAGNVSVLTIQGTDIQTVTTSIQVTTSSGGSTGTTPAKPETTSISALQALLPGATISVGSVIPTVISYFFMFIALSAFIALLYSGFLYITAGGDMAQTEKARKNIGWALTGIVVALFSYVLVLLVPLLVAGKLITSSNSSGTTGGTVMTVPFQVTDSKGAALTDTIIGDASKKDFSTNVCVVLASQPAASLGVDVTTDGNLPLLLSTSQISFTPDIWSTPQCVVLSYKGDGTAGQSGEVIVKYAQDTAQRIKFSVNGTSTTSGTGTTPVGEIQPNLILSDGSRRVVLTDLSVNLITQPSLTLASKPSGTVMVTISVNGVLPLIVSPATLTFTQDNWDKPQLLTISYIGGMGTKGQLSLVTAAVGKLTDSINFAAADK